MFGRSCSRLLLHLPRVNILEVMLSGVPKKTKGWDHMGLTSTA